MQQTIATKSRNSDKNEAGVAVGIALAIVALCVVLVLLFVAVRIVRKQRSKRTDRRVRCVRLGFLNNHAELEQSHATCKPQSYMTSHEMLVKRASHHYICQVFEL